jgi:hypothetical protein
MNPSRLLRVALAAASLRRLIGRVRFSCGDRRRRPLCDFGRLLTERLAKYDALSTARKSTVPMSGLWPHGGYGDRAA